MNLIISENSRLRCLVCGDFGSSVKRMEIRGGLVTDSDHSRIILGKMCSVMHQRNGRARVVGSGNDYVGMLHNKFMVAVMIMGWMITGKLRGYAILPNLAIMIHTLVHLSFIYLLPS